MEHTSIQIKNYKCFDEAGVCIAGAYPINLIVGRNNTGKSSLLDILDVLTKGQFSFSSRVFHDGNAPTIELISTFSEKELRGKFDKMNAGGGLPGSNHWETGEKFINGRVRWVVTDRTESRRFEVIEPSECVHIIQKHREARDKVQLIVNQKTNPFAKLQFFRISAERNIEPETANSKLEILGNGRGITNVVQNFLNRANLDRSLIEETLKHELNVVMGPDANIERISTRQLENGSWEIYLEESAKGAIPLSQSGSGFKTILTLLVCLHVYPQITGVILHNLVVGIEEPENNMHPSLLRRVLNYLYEFAHKEGARFFITSHSSVAIDMYSRRPESQIIHVSHNGRSASCQTITSFRQSTHVLDDLDIRASDLLQSNGLIWVEGPTDRIYLSTWIELWSNGELLEGVHYQCVFYGGRLLSHLSSDDPGMAGAAIPILSVNRSSVFVMDSDKKSENDKVNSTKLRISQEVTNSGGKAWITAGREIENYISATAVDSWLGVSSKSQVSQYEDFFIHLDRIQDGVGKRFKNDKVRMAEAIRCHFSKEVLDVLDLSSQLSDVCQLIEKWNGIERCE